jgi:hypothetical protein
VLCQERAEFLQDHLDGDLGAAHRSDAAFKIGRAVWQLHICPLQTGKQGKLAKQEKLAELAELRKTGGFMTGSPRETCNAIIQSGWFGQFGQSGWFGQFRSLAVRQGGGRFQQFVSPGVFFEKFLGSPEFAVVAF